MLLSQTIITETSPEQRALLYNALLFFKTHAQEAFAESVIQDDSKLFKDFYRHTDKELQQLINDLFADTHIDELDYIRQFNRQYIKGSGFISNQSKDVLHLEGQ